MLIGEIRRVVFFSFSRNPTSQVAGLIEIILGSLPVLQIRSLHSKKKYIFYKNYDILIR